MERDAVERDAVERDEVDRDDVEPEPEAREPVERALVEPAPLRVEREEEALDFVIAPRTLSKSLSACLLVFAASRRSARSAAVTSL